MLFLFCFRTDWSRDQDSHGNDTESDDPSQLHSSQGWRECLHIRFVLFYKLVCVLIYISVYSMTSTIWCGTHNRAGLQFKTVLTDNPPSPGEAGYTTGVLRPLLFSNSGVGSFTSHKNKSVKVLWDGTYGFSSLSEKTRKSNHLQMSLQRQHFLLSCLKTPIVGLAGVWTRDLPLSRPALSQLS